MAEDGPRDWTAGAPKWAAIILLGGAALLAIGWAIGREGVPWGSVRASSAPATAPMPAAPAAPVAQPIVSQPMAPPDPAPASPKLAAAAEKPPETIPSIRKLINVNTATQAELELLPGIGPALAKRIMDFRANKGPFKRLEDLDAVKGIGPRTLERLRPLVAFD